MFAFNQMEVPASFQPNLLDKLCAFFLGIDFKFVHPFDKLPSEAKSEEWLFSKLIDKVQVHNGLFDIASKKTQDEFLDFLSKTIEKSSKVLFESKKVNFDDLDLPVDMPFCHKNFMNFLISQFGSAVLVVPAKHFSEAILENKRGFGIFSYQVKEPEFVFVDFSSFYDRRYGRVGVSFLYQSGDNCDFSLENVHQMFFDEVVQILAEADDKHFRVIIK